MSKKSIIKIDYSRKLKCIININIVISFNTTKKLLLAIYILSNNLTNLLFINDIDKINLSSIKVISYYYCFLFLISDKIIKTMANIG